MAKKAAPPANQNKVRWVQVGMLFNSAQTEIKLNGSISLGILGEIKIQARTSQYNQTHVNIFVDVDELPLGQLRRLAQGLTPKPKGRQSAAVATPNEYPDDDGGQSYADVPPF